MNTTDETVASDELTLPGQVMGTPGYMSPEQARGETVDARSDLFSLGVVLYLLLTSREPFGGENMGECIASTLRDEPASVLAWAPEAPAATQDIVARCLQKRVTARYGSASELLVDLEQLDRTLPDAARAETPTVVEHTRSRVESTDIAGTALADGEDRPAAVSGRTKDGVNTSGMTSEPAGAGTTGEPTKPEVETDNSRSTLSRGLVIGAVLVAAVLVLSLLSLRSEQRAGVLPSASPSLSPDTPPTVAASDSAAKVAPAAPRRGGVLRYAIPQTLGSFEVYNPVSDTTRESTRCGGGGVAAPHPGERHRAWCRAQGRHER